MSHWASNKVNKKNIVFLRGVLNICGLFGNTRYNNHCKTSSFVSWVQLDYHLWGDYVLCKFHPDLLIPFLPILLDRSLCPKGVSILEEWCSTPYTQRDTGLCPYLVNFYILYIFLLSHLWGSSILIPPPPLSEARTLPHRPCLRATDLPFLCHPSGSARSWGSSLPSETVNIH